MLDAAVEAIAGALALLADIAELPDAVPMLEEDDAVAADAGACCSLDFFEHAVTARAAAATIIKARLRFI